MKTMQATEAKNRFGELLEDAISEPVIIQKNGRDVAVLMSKAEFDLHYCTVSKKELVARYHEESMERFGALYEALAK
jgi:prevent-host-death family protein